MSRSRCRGIFGREGFFRRRGLFMAWLVFIWAALWASVSPAVVVSGLLLSAAILLLYPAPAPRPVGAFRPLPAVRFAIYFVYKLVQANLVVAWEVITPKSRINQGVVRVPIEGASDAVVTLVANAISLTPGTLTVEVRRGPTVLYIHVLHLRSVEQVRRDVRRLESLALRAFATGEVESDDVEGRQP